MKTVKKMRKVKAPIVGIPVKMAKLPRKEKSALAGPARKVVLPKTKAILTFVEAALPEIKEMEDYISRISIQTTEHYRWAAKLLNMVAARHDAIDTKRKEWTESLRLVMDDINGTLKPPLVSLKAIESAAKAKMSDFVVACVGAGQEVPPLETASVTVDWGGEVVDASKLPAAYLMQVPNVEALRAATKATGAKTVIPGWKPQLEASIRTQRT